MTENARSEHFLAQIEAIVDWASIAQVAPRGDGKAQDGEALPAIKMLLLAHWYGMGEVELFDAIQDRLSFRRFLELPLTDTGGDAAHHALFRQLNALGSATKLIEAADTQLRARGLGIKPGAPAEAMVVPVAGGGDAAQLSETSIFQPGEISALLRRDESLLVRSGARMAADGASENADAATPQPVVESDIAPVHASLEWPWGATTALAERLVVGRDRDLCPHAGELAKYPHVSRRHCELTPCPMGIWVRDLHSHNGTFLDGERLPAGNASLVDTDAQIRFGPYCVVQLRLEAQT